MPHLLCSSGQNSPQSGSPARQRLQMGMEDSRNMSQSRQQSYGQQMGMEDSYSSRPASNSQYYDQQGYSYSQPNSPTPTRRTEDWAQQPAGRTTGPLGPQGRAMGAYQGNAATRGIPFYPGNDAGASPNSMYSPTGNTLRNMNLPGHTANIDVVVPTPNEVGLTGAHTRKDGINPFEGYYSKEHAGKISSTTMGALYHDPSSFPPPPMKPTGPAPWDAPPSPSRLGLKMDTGVVQPSRVDHLYNSYTGLSDITPSEQRALRAPGMPGRAAGLAHVNEGIIGSAPEHQRPNQFAGMTSKSHITGHPQGLTEQGTGPTYQPSVRCTEPGKTSQSVLANSPMGYMAVKEGPSFRPIQHAGKMTASQIVQSGQGIGGLPRNKPAAAGENPHNHYSSVVMQDKYSQYQQGQAQMRQKNETLHHF